MKHVLLLLAFLITGAIPLQAQTPRPEVKILMEIRPEVNYVTHLYTLAGLGFADSVYAAKYGNTLSQAARAIAEVYVTHYDAYLKNVYPQVKAGMEERRQLLTQKMQEQSFVKDWERVKGYTWLRGDYHAFGEADVQTFCRIFDRLSKEGISDPAELYRKGIIEYLEE